jgi:predicted metalloprotease with PDZ domain
LFSTRFKLVVFLCALMLSPHLASQTDLNLNTVPQQDTEVFHRISFPDINQQYVHVYSEFPVQGTSVTIRMANWTPGSYLIRDFSADLNQISFKTETGDSLDHVKTSKSSWLLDLKGNSKVIVEYDVHAGDLSVQTSWVSQEFILLNGASVFFYSDESRDQVQRLEVQLNPSLGIIRTPLQDTGQPGEFLASGFDELVDSPIVIANGLAHRFVVNGHEYALLNVGANGLWDGQRSSSDLKSVVTAVNDFWGVQPFDSEYWFFNLLVERSGGLEHDNSTVLMSSRWQMRDRDDYIKWLSLAAHEYFHAWNVRRMRPLSLARINYEHEQYTGALWLAEGITSYYDNLLLSRAGLIEPAEYFKRLAIDLHGLELTPGRKHISLDAASRDSWVRHYQQDANSLNSTISYYTKGAVLGLLLDARIRRESEDDASLDDVMRLMFDRWGETPYPEDAFADAIETVAGVEIRQWLEPMLNSTVKLDVDEALKWFGLILDRHPLNNAARAGKLPLIAELGVNWDTELEALTVKNVIAGMNGSKAGLLPDDELLAINGERVSSETIDDRLVRLQPGTDVSLLIARRGRILNIPITIEEARSATYELKLSPEFGKRELKRLESWLGQSLQTDQN